jgi:hypothetical protein
MKGSSTWHLVVAIGLSLLVLAAYQIVTDDRREPPLTFTVLEALDAEILVPARGLDNLTGGASGQGVEATLRVTPDRRLLVTVDDRLVELLGWDQGTLKVARLLDGISLHDFTVDESGTVWGVTSEGIGRLEGDQFRIVIPMSVNAFDRVRIAVSHAQRTVFLQRSGSVVSISDKASPKYLIDGVLAISPTSRGLIAATSSQILFYRDGSLTLVANAKLNYGTYRGWSGPSIRSIAYSAKTNTVFYSTNESVYAVKGFDSVALAADLSGSIAYADGDLYVMDETKRIIVKLAHVDEL